MIHFIRTKDNKTVVDVEAMPDEIRSVVIIEEFAKLLLGFESDVDRNAFIDDIASLQEIRAVYWEGIETGRGGGETTDELAERMMKPIAKKYDLGYVR